MKRFGILVALLLWSIGSIHASPSDGFEPLVRGGMDTADSVVVYDDTVACDSLTVTDNNGPRTITASGTYRLVYTAATGIDSIVMRTVTIHLATHNSSTVTEMGYYIWHDSAYAESGTYIYQYTNADRCPSADTLHLTVEPCVTLYMNQYVDACDEYLWSDGVTYNESTTDAYDTLIVDGGCLLILRLNLTIHHGTHNIIYDTAEGSFTWHNNVYTYSGVYTYNYNDLYGCASTDTLYLEIVNTFAPVLVDEAHPFFDDFEDGLRWTFISSYPNNDYRNPNVWHYGTSVAHTGTHSIYISNDNGATNSYNGDSYSYSYASKLFILPQGSFSFSYDWRANGRAPYDRLRVFLAPASEQIPPIGHISYSVQPPDSWIEIGYRYYTPDATAWHTRTSSIDITDSGIYNLLFYWTNDILGGFNPPAAVDNVGIVKTSCQPPASLSTIAPPTSTAATLSWSGSAFRYTVAYGTAYSPTDIDTLVVSGNSVRLTGLSPSSEYHVFVRQWCSTTHISSWSNMYTFRTACGSLTQLPFNEGFETNWDRTSPDEFENNCWHILSIDNNNPHILHTGSLGHSGNKYINWNIGTSSRNTYLVMPQLHTASIDFSNLYVSFWAKCENTAGGQLLVGIMDNATDTGSFTPVDTVYIQHIPSTNPNYQNPLWAEYGVDLSHYQGTGSYIAFRPCHSAAGNAWIGLDDFTLDYLPDLSTSDTTVVACDSYTWQDSTYTASGVYTHMRRVHGILVYDTLRLTIGHDTTGDTVAVACDSFNWYGTNFTSDTNATRTISSVAGCDSVVTLHLTILHPTTGTDSITACDRYTWVNGITYTTNNYGSTYTLVDSHGCDSTVTLYLTLRHSSRRDTTATACDSFSWRGTSYTSSTSATSITSNAVGCDSVVTLHLTLHHSATRDTVAIACDSFSWYGTSFTSDTSATRTTSTIFGCDSTVTLHLTIGHGTFNVLYDTAELQYYWHGTTYNYGDDGTYTYDYLNADGCASTDTLHLVLLPAAPVLVDETHPFFDDFESGLRWTLINDTMVNRWCYGTAAHHGGAHALYISNDHGVTNSYQKDISPIYARYSVSASKLFSLSPGTYSFSYDWRSVGEAYLDYLFVYLEPQATPNDWIQLSTNHRPTAYWTRQQSIVDISDTGIYQMVFLWQFNQSRGEDPPAAIDNIGIEKYSCSTPTDIATIGQPTSTSATIGWSGTGSRYIVAYGTTLSLSPADMDTISVTGDTVTLTGLTPSSTYNLFVRALCDESSLSAWSSMYTFRTDCGLLTELPYVEDFESPDMPTDGVHCWNIIFADTPHIPPRVFVDPFDPLNTSSFSNHSLFVGQYGDSWGYYVLPGINTDSISIHDLYIRFKVLPDGDFRERIEVGVMENSTDTGSFVLIDFLDFSGVRNSPNQQWTEYAVSLHSYQGNGSYIALRIPPHWLSLDDFTIDHLNPDELTPIVTDAVACDSYTWGDSTYSVSGIHTRLRRIHGIPVHDTLRLTIGHDTTGDTIAVACDHFEWYGTIFTSDTSATRTTSSIIGCDSVVTLHLTVNYSTTGDTTATACDNFTWNGTSYTSSTSATSITSNAAGCDSTVTLHLTVNYGIYASTYTAACDTFAWHDSVYTSSGTYLFVDETTEGCPMVDTLVLTLSTGTSTGYHAETCDSYVWNGTLYTETGNYIHDYSQLGGDCQNVDTLFLVIHPSTYIEVYDTACDSYLWEGTSYTSSTSATSTTSTVFGCDSTVTLHLTLHYNTSTAYTDSLVDDTYTWHGQTYIEVGTYLYDYITDEGCASTDTLYLIDTYIPVYYTIHATSADTTMGYVVIYPDTTLLEGSTAFVVAVPHEGYRFLHWDDSDTNGTRIFVITSDTTFVAYFEANTDIDMPTFRIWTEGDIIHIEGTAIDGLSVKVYDLLGRPLYNQPAEGNHVTINASYWAAAIYLVRLSSLPVQRIIIMR